MDENGIAHKEEEVGKSGDEVEFPDLLPLGGDEECDDRMCDDVIDDSVVPRGLDKIVQHLALVSGVLVDNAGEVNLDAVVLRVRIIGCRLQVVIQLFPDKLVAICNLFYQCSYNSS